MAQDSLSSLTVSTGSGFFRSSHWISAGTPTRITKNNTAYLTMLTGAGRAMKVIVTTTGLKLGELNKNPKATSTRPLPRVTPHAAGTAQLAQTPMGTPTSAPFRELRYRFLPILSG